MKPGEITIFLMPNEAELFVEFQKYYKLFNLLVEKKVFNQKGAAITLHFDINGDLRTIARADVLYSASSKFENSN